MLGRYAEAEFILTRGVQLGHPQAAVQLANCVRIVGRNEEALRMLDDWLPRLRGEDRFTALRWKGVLLHCLHQHDEGVALAEEAYLGFQALGDTVMAVKTLQSLAEMHRVGGSRERARQILKVALAALPAGAGTHTRMPLLRTLQSMNIEAGHLHEARALLEQMQSFPDLTERHHIQFLVDAAELALAEENEEEYERILNEGMPRARAFGEDDLLWWFSARLAWWYAQTDRPSEAVEVLYEYGSRDRWQGAHWIAMGVVNRSRGRLEDARADFMRACALSSTSRRVDHARALLYLAALDLAEQRVEQAITHAREAFRVALDHHVVHALRPSFRYVREVVALAMIEPALEVDARAVLDVLRGLSSATVPTDHRRVTLRLKTLGSTSVTLDGKRLKLRGFPVAVLMYLHEHPGAAAPELYAALASDDRNEAVARQAMHVLKKELGEGVIHTDRNGPVTRHQLARHVHVQTDIDELYDAVARSDVPGALAAYEGEFLPEFKDPAAWIAARRDAAFAAFTGLLRREARGAYERGDHQRAVLLTNQHLKFDQYDIETLELRVAAARHVASERELVTYQAELAAQLLGT